MTHSLVFTVFLIFAGAAVLATVALYARQALIVAYIALGILFGPSLLGWVSDATLIQGVADFGIMFLLFLLGLNMYPQKLWQLLRQATVVTFASSALFALAGVVTARLFGFGWLESAVIGSTLMFSSTIIGLKLLPATVLHHQHTGEIIISVLLLQDLIAILLLVLLQARGGQDTLLFDIGRLVVALGGLIVLAWVIERFVLIRLFARFDQIQEYIFLLTIGWCLGMAALAQYLGLSHEIGAFIAGVAIASNRISLFIAESLKPLRDFFLIIFFFAIGAAMDLRLFGAVILPAAVLAAMMLMAKPLVFAFLLRRSGESTKRAGEVGVRLGQGSEFSFLIALLALQTGAIGQGASYVIQLSALLTFIVSTHLIVLRYPTPIAINPELRRN
ncbi:MAG: sodium:proton antiporter [Candidatus Muproteobacteria bacterium RBG_16_62_13]|uniref:Sodium:proton antiporter n=1 Tax=Candidatus Muproteobacteria bacterium RBG_16_62_13 TaxID=1817756 RepID=A0A1F6SXS8_9PROT|nr:MAG: sodium:proton antiporter [Candidatus Muproteobacteria bacterium RBG_16_62_13]